MQMQRRIIHALLLMSILFLSLIAYLTYFELFSKIGIVGNAYNRRLRAAEEKVLRGNILDRNKVILAHSVGAIPLQQRKYPFGTLYSHIIGYSSSTYGKSLLEANFNDFLIGQNELNTVFDLKNKLIGNALSGNHLVLTIDHALQQVAAQALGGKKGAIVAIQPKTGEILAMLSKPDFDPQEPALKNHWHRLVESEDFQFLPRATAGRYTPGSTFKVLVGAAALENEMQALPLEDNGKLSVDGKTIQNFGGKAYGPIRLKQALTYSSNVAFAKIGLALGQNKIRDIALRAGFNTKIPFDIAISQSEFYTGGLNQPELAATAIGQGKTLTSPIHMALISAAIANQGAMMQPILVSKIHNNDGVILKSQKPIVMRHIMASDIATALTEMMVEVVNSGTGKNAAISGIKVAGKTGTAENEQSGKDTQKDHAWFIGFAPVENPSIAVAVILEYSGSTGGDAAAPIARELMAAWIAKNK